MKFMLNKPLNRTLTKRKHPGCGYGNPGVNIRVFCVTSDGPPS